MSAMISSSTRRRSGADSGPTGDSPAAASRKASRSAAGAPARSMLSSWYAIHSSLRAVAI
ncbi:Uncharacterised protein [Mycobacteroides abscessus subsp. abscessus]|nr:Uncharacterised protein [Mycobacteroides abscessus subsp. abscessus]